MTAHLPVPGVDRTGWGTTLNDWLGVAHNADGTLKAGLVVAAPTGVAATDLASIQTTIDTCAAAGGGVVFAPPGTYVIAGRLDVKANVTLRGAGMNATTIQSASAAADRESIRLRGDNDVAIEDLTVDVNNRASGSWPTGALGILTELAVSSTVANRHAVRRCRVKNSTNNVVRSTNATLDYVVKDCVFEDSEDGVTIYEVVGVAHKGISIVGNRFRRMGTAVGGEFSHCVQLFASADHAFLGVLVADNDMRDFTTPSTAIPVEVNHADDVVMRGNTVGSVATRGLGAGNCYGLAVADNTIVDQTIYAFELGANHGFAITGNVMKNCASFIHETASAGAEDGLIANNVYMGSGASGLVSGGNAIKLPWARRIRITNNEFNDWQYLREAIRVGEAGTAEDVAVHGNTFVVTDANTPITAINLCKTIRSSVTRNMIRVKRNLAAGDDYLGTICLHNNVESADLLVEDNESIFTGTVGAATNAAGVAHNGNISAFALTGTTVKDNRVIRGPRGVRLVINSTDLIVTKNYTSTCSNPDVIPSTAIRAYELEPQWFPTYRTASYYFCNSPAASGTSITLGNGNFRASPWVVTKPITITRIGAEFTAAGDAASVFRIGIYADDGTGVPTGAPVLDAGSISTGTGNAGTVATGGTPGVYEITISQILQPGVYWVGGAVQGVTVTQPTLRTVSTIIAPLAFTAIPGTGAATVGWTLTGQTGALGTWSGTGGSGSAVRILFKTT